MEGCGWSDFIGWVQFGSPAGNPMPVCPGTNCNAFIDTVAEPEVVRGWARALSNGDGWDGWISLNCLDDTVAGCSPNYKVNVGIGTMGASSYAWGSDVVGWVDMSPVTFVKQCTPPDRQCTGEFPAPDRDKTDQWCVRTPDIPCSGGQYCWGAGQCKNLADGELDISATKVRYEGTVDVGWTLTMWGDIDTSVGCRITSNNGDNKTGNIFPTLSPTPSKEITYQTIFELYCTHSDGGESLVDTKTVDVLPTYQEL